MKKAILISLILISGICYGQKDSTIYITNPKTGQKDTIYQPKNDVPILSVDDLNGFLKALNRISHEEYLKLTPQATLQYLYQYGIDMYNERRKKKK